MSTAHRRPDRRQQLIATVIDITVTRGLDHVSVREVAKAAEVSIGAVQHHFPTKDSLLVAAFEAVVADVRSRLLAVELVDDVGVNVSTVLQQLIPLDDERDREARVIVAFGARAAVAPNLRAVQADLLAGIRDELVEVLGAHHVSTARALLALVDGLSFQHVSAGPTLDPGEMVDALERAINALVSV